MKPGGVPRSKRGQDALTAGLFLALAVVSLVFFRIVWPALFWPLYALALVALVTLPWRTVRLRLVGLAFFTRAGPVMGVTLLLQWGLLALAGTTPGLTAWIESHLLLWGGEFGSGLVAPVTEEILKILPLVLFLNWLRRRGASVLGPLDVILLGVAIGAGFDFSEHLFRTTAAGGAVIGFDSLEHVGPQWGVFHLFPTLTTNIWGKNVCFSHTGWTGMVAVGLALSYWLGQRRVWVSVLPWLLGLWAIWDHYLWNSGAVVHPWLEDSLLAKLPALDGYGRVMPYAFLVGLAVAAFLSAWAVRRYSKADSALALPRGPGGLGRVTDLYALVHGRRALAYGTHTFVDAGQPGGLEGQPARALATLRGSCLALVERSGGSRGGGVGMGPRLAGAGGSGGEPVTAGGREGRGLGAGGASGLRSLALWAVAPGGVASAAGVLGALAGRADHATGGGASLAVLFAFGNYTPEGLMGLLLLGLVFGIIGAACFPGLWWAGLAGLLAGLIAGGLIDAGIDTLPSDLLSSVLGKCVAGP
jgi:RsiW-degrading membrane proteinase PrsW (M82 family)